MTSATVLRIYYNVNNGTKRWVDDILPIQKQMFYSVFRQKDTKQPVFEYCLYVVGIAFFSPSFDYVTHTNLSLKQNKVCVRYHDYHENLIK